MNLYFWSRVSVYYLTSYSTFTSDISISLFDSSFGGGGVWVYLLSLSYRVLIIWIGSRNQTYTRGSGSSTRPLNYGSRCHDCPPWKISADPVFPRRKYLSNCDNISLRWAIGPFHSSRERTREQ